MIGEILRLSAARFPDKTALIDGARRTTYAELDARANRFAAALAAHGIVKGARIGVLAANCGDVATIFYGAARAGVIMAPLSTRTTAGDVAYMLNKIGAEALFHSGDLGAIASAARGAIASLRHVVALDDRGEAGGGAFDAFLASGAAAPIPPPSPDDPLAITFTGGTTGRPKAVVVTHRARYATAVTGGVEFGLDERDVALVATPLFHAAGLFVWFQTAVMLGLTCVILPRWDPSTAIALIERHGCTATLLVPTQLGDLIADPGFAPERLASLRHMHYAGSPMALAVLDRAQALLPHVGFTENYGQSETGPMTVRRPFHPHDKRGSVGRPAHNVETRVLDTAGRECAVGVVGEIATRGPHVFSYYWDDPDETRQSLRTGDGWLWTGDLGFRDADGFLHLVDRVKDMIVSGAENIYPAEVENALYLHPAVGECAVFGVPDDRWGEVPAAHVVLKPGASASEAELIAFVEGQIARYKRPRFVRIVEVLPRTAVGKIQKSAIREPYWAGRTRRI